MSTVTSSLTDKYELLEALSTSALVATHRARERATGALYAVTVPRSHLVQDSRATERLRDLLQRVQRLEQPSIASIKEVGGTETDLWVVSELIEAPTLKDFLAQGMALGPALEALAQTAEALDTAHRAGVVHGDVRPRAVHLLPDGSARVAEFGMASLVQAVHPLMRAALLTPLPPYMPPEVLRGSSTSPSGDIYSLGMLLYELVTGILPFPGYNPETVRVKQEESSIPRPSEVNPALPAAFDALLARALAWRPEDRYPSAGVLAQELRALRAQLTGEQARLLVPPGVTPPTDERAAAAARLTAATSTATRLCPVCLTPNPLEASYCRECWRVLGDAPPLTPEEERTFTLAARRRARTSRLMRRGLLAAAFLAALAVIFWDRSTPPGLLAPAPVSALSSATGEGLWTSPRNGAAGAGSTQTSSPLPSGAAVRWQRELGAEIVSSPAVADGRVFVTTLDRRILALDARDGATIWEVPTSSPMDASPIVAEDKVYTVFRDSTLVALSTATGQEVWRRDLRNPIFSWIAVDNGILYALNNNGFIQTFDAQTGELRWELETDYRFIAPPAVADDRLIAPTLDGRVLVFSGRTGATGLVFLVRRSVEGSAAVVGDTAIFGGNERSIRAINIHARNLPLEKSILKWWAQLYIWGIANFPPAQSGTVWTRILPQSVRSSPAVSGNRVLATTTDGTLYAVSLTSGEELWRIPLQQGKALPGSPIVVNDVVYVGTERGEIHAVDLETGERLWKFQASGPIPGNPAFASGTLYFATQNGAVYALD